eukprot:m51a1_g10518 hypothetical protein (3412) ;mRNA; f:200861-214054
MSWPGYYTLYCALFGVLVLAILFGAPRLLGAIVTRALNLFLGRGKSRAHVHIGRIYVTPVGGKLLFSDLLFSTPDTTLRVVDGCLTVRWWSSRVRDYGDASGDYPCRLDVRLEGVEYLWHNRTDAYDRLDALARQRQGEAAAVEVVETLVSASQYTLPRGLALVPAVSFAIHRACIMLGNPELPTITVVTFRRAKGVHWIGPAPSELDYYRSTSDWTLTRARLRIIPNPHFEYGTQVVNEQMGEGVGKAMESFKLFVEDCRQSFYDPDSRDDEIPRRERSADEPAGFGVNGAPPAASECAEAFGNPKDGLLLESPTLTLSYYTDVPGPVPNGFDQLVFDPETAPKWGLNFVVNSAKMRYGPWADRQRSRLFAFLFPQDFEDQKVHTPVPGRPREYAAFKIAVQFEKGLSWKVPFRDMYKREALLKALASGLMPPENPDATDCSLDIDFSERCSLLFAMDYVARTAAGPQTLITMTTEEISCRTTVNNVPILSAAGLTLDWGMQYPLKFNEKVDMRLRVDLKKPRIFPVYDHIGFFQNLSNDWSSTDKAPSVSDGLFFSPKEVHVTIVASDYALLLNVNQMNVTNNPNDLDDNAHFVLSSPETTVTVSVPPAAFLANKRSIEFHVRGKNLVFSLLLPKFNTVRQNLDPDENITMPVGGSVTVEEYNWNRGLGCPFVWGENLDLSTYLYYTFLDPANLDSLELNIKARTAALRLFGFFVQHILVLKDNWAGLFQHARTSKQFEEGYKFPPEDPSNAFEVYVQVDVREGTLLLPLNLYSSKKQATATFDQLLVEARIIPAYVDLSLSFSPLYGQVPILTSENETPLGEAFDISNRSYISINSFSFHLYWLFGPRPVGASYRETYNLRVGLITGHVALQQLISIVSWLTNFIFLFDNKDNKLSWSSKGDPDPIFATVSVEVTGVSVYLWAANSVTQIAVGEPLIVGVNTFVNHLQNAKISILLPDLLLRHLVPDAKFQQRYYTELKEWTEVGSTEVAFRVTLFIKDPTWEKDAAKQRAFLMEQDRETKRLPFLWVDDEEDPNPDTAVAAAASSSAARPLIRLPAPALQHPLQERLAALQNVQSPRDKAMLDVPPPGWKGKGEAKSAASPMDMSPETSVGAPLQHSRSAAASSLTWSSHSRATSFADKPTDVLLETRVPRRNSRKRRSQRAEPSGQNPPMDPVSSLSRRSSSFSDAMYLTADEGESESDSDSEYQSADEGEMMSLRSSERERRKRMSVEQKKAAATPRAAPPATPSIAAAAPEEHSSLGFSPMNPRASLLQDDQSEGMAKERPRSKFLRKCAFTMRHQAVLALQETLPQSAFQQAKSMGVSFFSKSKGTKAPLQSSFQTLSSAPAPRSAMKKRKDSRSKGDDWTSFFSRKGASEYLEVHRTSASTVTIVVDSLRDIKIVSAPVVLRIFEQLAHSSNSVDSVLDAFQIGTIAAKSRSWKFHHERVQLIMSLRNIDVFLIPDEVTSDAGKEYISTASLRNIQLQFAVCPKEQKEPKDSKESKDAKDSRETKSKTPDVTIQSSLPTLPRLALSAPVSPKAKPLEVASPSAPSPSLIGETTDIVNAEELCSAELCVNANGFSLSISEANENEESSSEAEDGELSPSMRKLISLDISSVRVEGACRRDQAQKLLEVQGKAVIPNVALDFSTGSPVVVVTTIRPWIVAGGFLATRVEQHLREEQQMLRALVTGVLQLRLFLVPQDASPEIDGFPQEESELIGTLSRQYRKGWEDIAMLRKLMKPLDPAMIHAAMRDFFAADRRTLDQFRDRILTLQGNRLTHLELRRIVESPCIQKIFTKPRLTEKPFQLNASVELGGFDVKVKNGEFTNTLEMKQFYGTVIAANNANRKTVFATVGCDGVTCVFGPNLLDLAEAVGPLIAASPKSPPMPKEPAPSTSPFDVSVRVAFPLIDVRAVSVNYGTLNLIVKSLSVLHSTVKPTYELGEAEPPQCCFQTVVSVPTASLELHHPLADGSATRSSCKCALHGCGFVVDVWPEALLPVDNVALSALVKGVSLAFRVDEEFLSRMFGFSNEWADKAKHLASTTAESAASASPAPAAAAPAEAAAGEEEERSLALALASVDIGAIEISTVMPPVSPTKYEIGRMFVALAKGADRYELCAEMPKHTIVIAAKSSERTELVMAPAKAVVTLSSPHRAPVVVCGRLELGSVKNTLDVTVVNNILALQWLLRRDVDRLVAALHASKKRPSAAAVVPADPLGGAKEGSPKPPKASILDKVRIAVAIVVEAGVLEVVSPDAVVQMKIDELETVVKETQMVSKLVPFNWKMRFVNCAMSLRSTMSQETVAGLGFDMSLQNFSDKRDSVVDSVWISLGKTTATLRPWSLDACTSMWLYYYSSAVSFIKDNITPMEKRSCKRSKTPAPAQEPQRAGGSDAEDPLAKRAVSLYVTVLDTKFVLPLESPGDQSCSIVLSLGSFFLAGNASKAFHMHGVLGRANARKILGKCSFSSIAVRFVDGGVDVARDRGAEDAAAAEASSRNSFVLDGGQASLAMLVSAFYIIASAEVDTSGASVSFTGKISKYFELIREAAMYGQERFMKVVDSTSGSSEGPASPVQERPRTPHGAHDRGFGVELDLKMRTEIGSLTLGTAAKLTTPSQPRRKWHALGKQNAEQNGGESSMTTSLPSSLTSVHFSHMPDDDKSAVFVSRVTASFQLEEGTITLTPFLSYFLSEALHTLHERTGAKARPKSIHGEDALKAAAVAPAAPAAAPAAAAVSPRPAAAGAARTLATINVGLRINTTVIEFMCAPFNEVVCRMEAEFIDVMFSSTIPADSSPAGAGPIVDGLTVNVPCFVVKLHHAQFPEQSTWARVTNARAFVGALPSGMREGTQAVSVFASVEEASGSFSIKRLHEVAIFVDTWTAPFTLRRRRAPSAPAAAAATPDSSSSSAPRATAAQEAEQQQQGGQGGQGAGRSSVALVVVALQSGETRFDIELPQSIGLFQLAVGRTFAECRVSTAALAEGREVTLMAGLGDVVFTSTGTLQGKAESRGISVLGTTNVEKRSLTATVLITPPTLTFSYAMSPTLFFRAGQLALCLYYTGATGGVRARVSLAGLEIQVSCETINGAVTAFVRLMESVREQLANVETHHRRMLRDLEAGVLLSPQRPHHLALDADLLAEGFGDGGDGGRGPAGAGARARRGSGAWAHCGELEIDASKLNVMVFGESVRDSTWALFVIDSCSVALKLSQQDGILRNLSICFTRVQLSKATDANPAQRATWERTAQLESILEVPQARLTMATRQETDDALVSPGVRELDSWFGSEFPRPIVVSLHVPLYAYLNTLATLYKGVVASAKQEAVLIAEYLRGGDKPAAAAAKAAHGAPAQTDLRLEQRSFVLEPVLNVLGGLTPSVSTALGWAGIQSPSVTIPLYTHVVLTEPLEEVLYRLWRASRDTLGVVQH